jgi:hypothetical protein
MIAYIHNDPTEDTEKTVTTEKQTMTSTKANKRTADKDKNIGNK